MAIIYLGLGSNLGDRTKHIHHALGLLAEQGIVPLRLSSIIETEPVGGPPQGFFLNAVLKARTELLPLDLLKVTQAVEMHMGRERTVINGPRLIDIDILLYDDLNFVSGELIIPHPRMYERDFVLKPLREVGGAVV